MVSASINKKKVDLNNPQAIMMDAGANNSIITTPLAPAPTPAPVQQQNKNTQVRFNPDGTVDYNVGGQNTNLSQNDYGELVKRQMASSGDAVAGGNPAIQSLIKLEQNQRLKNEIDAQLKQGATISEITAQLLNQQQNQQMQTMQPLQTDILSQVKSKDINSTNQQEDQKVLSPINQFGANIGAGSLQQVRKNIQDNSLRTVANIYDFAESLFHGGKGTTQREAEQTFSKIEGDLSSDIALVKIGLKDPINVKNKIAIAEAANNRLESSIKGLGKLNLRYWLTDGKDVEAQLANNKDNLNDFRRQLAIAEQEYNLNAAKTNYGLQ